MQSSDEDSRRAWVTTQDWGGVPQAGFKLPILMKQQGGRNGFVFSDMLLSATFCLGFRLCKQASTLRG
ncbi:hypothetical protein CHLRE_16g668502v5 [Chlamydomonas reinhardtii]|uniref:Uncharacterized protein n=1 Tax=Chlamydomonas reinhardtii TaxID=3055 RepID=A0A2K3CUE3_CHLRE|nr:uncharacterized protein CHLRE_16g668502v5 [Chlamydomonas reinhardtii]PNW71900.1 hypothetical protein CHLRE_16g668502v5 [Chlamydomonas reinhardtii]